MLVTLIGTRRGQLRWRARTSRSTPPWRPHRRSAGGDVLTLGGGDYDQCSPPDRLRPPRAWPKQVGLHHPAEFLRGRSSKVAYRLTRRCAPRCPAGHTPAVPGQPPPDLFVVGGISRDSHGLTALGGSRSPASQARFVPGRHTTSRASRRQAPSRLGQCHRGLQTPLLPAQTTV